MSIFIDGEAEGEEAEGHDDDGEHELGEEGRIKHLIRDKTKRDRDGLHLEAGAQRRLDEEEEEAARLEAAAKRYESMGAAYISSRDGAGGSSFNPDSEMGEMTRAIRAARDEEEAKQLAAERAAERAAAAEAARVAALKKQALFDLYAEDDAAPAVAPSTSPASASASASAASASAVASSAPSASAGGAGDASAAAPGASETKGKYRIKKRKT